jgi:hypothetical protein
MALGTILASCTAPTPLRDDRQLEPVFVAAGTPRSTTAPAAAQLAEVPAAPLDASLAPLDGYPKSPAAAVAEPSPLPAGAVLQTERRRDHPWEVTVNGVGVSDDGFDAGSFQLQGAVGYYLSEVVELLVRQSVTMADAGDDVSANWNGASRVAIDLHLPLEAFVPFFGGSFGYIYGETTDDRFAGGPEAGFKLYLQSDAFLQLAVEYLFFFESSDALDDAFDDGTIFYSLGFGLRF